MLGFLHVRSLGACLVLVLLAVVMPGMAVAQSGPLRLEQITEAVSGQTLVIGSISYQKHGSEWDCGELLENCHLIIAASADDQVFVYGFKSAGDFAWSLPPGDYSILALDRGDSSMRVGLAFTVPDGPGAVYIGDLYLLIEKGMLTSGIGDNYTEALGQLEARFPEMVGSLSKSLMWGEGSLGTWTELSHVCSEEWGLRCNIRRQGIDAILPTRSRGPSFKIDELQPRFEWASSPGGGVTYDLALYEAVSFHGVAYRSHLVAYVQGLEESNWRPEQPLEPGRTYFWSVRVRAGNRISTWSTYTANYFAGALGLRTILTYGEWFRLDTPSG